MTIIGSEREALAVQRAALLAYDTDFKGYALTGTSPATRRTFALREPMFSAIPSKDFHEKAARLTLPSAMIGAQCELAFTIGRTFPFGGEAIDRDSAADAVVACQPTIGLLGRRTRPVGDSGLVAIADFAFHVATICGASARHIDPLECDAIDVTARIDGNVVAKARADSIDGHPLEAVMWLARQLSQSHTTLNAGDIVTTGSCTPVLQILPGQALTVEFSGLGTVSCTFR